MKVADISDVEALRAVHQARVETNTPFALLCPPYPPKVVLRKLERLTDKGLIEWGVSPNFPWLTPTGKALLDGSPEATESLAENER
jgi:hypothetical protein